MTTDFAPAARLAAAYDSGATGGASGGRGLGTNARTLSPKVVVVTIDPVMRGILKIPLI